MTPGDGFIVTYISDHVGKGGQHTNGPEFGVYRCEHPATRTAVEIHSYQVRSAHKARELAVTLCEMAVEEMTK